MKQGVDTGPAPVELKAVQRSMLNIVAAAKMLGIGQRNLWGMQNRGEIRSVKMGKRRLYDPRDLQAYIEKCKTPVQAV